MNRFVFAIAFLACSCGDNVEPLVPSSEAPIILTVNYPPLLVAYRGATDTEWKHADMVNPTTFQFYAHGPYLLTLVCRIGEQHLWVEQFAQTPEDRDVAAWCDPIEGPHRLTGRSVQSANIFTYSAIRSSDNSTPFEFRVPAGTYDVVAQSADLIAIRRGIAVSGETMIMSPIDTVAEGVSLLPLMTMVSNPLPSERYHRRLILRTQGGFYIDSAGELDGLRVVPNSLLLPADVQLLTVGGHNGVAGRAVTRKYREGDSASFTLPEFIGPVSFSQTDGALTATWTMLPEHDLISTSASGISVVEPSLFVIYDATYSRSFETSLGITNVTFDTSMPDFRPEWRMDFTKEYYQYIAVDRQLGNDTLGTGTSVRVNVPPMSASCRSNEIWSSRRGARQRWDFR